MFRNYIKVALRALAKQKTLSFINAFGIAIGIAACALIMLFVRDEYSYDRFHTNAEQIYRLNFVRFNPDGSVRGYNPNLPIPAGPATAAEVPEVMSFVRTSNDRHFFRVGESTIEQPVLYADPGVLIDFSFPLMLGDPSSALDDPRSVVLTHSAAKKYFQDDHIVGKTIEIRLEDAYELFTVTGVARDVPGNSTIQFEALLPFQTLISGDRYRERQEAWDLIAFPTYLTIADDAQPQAVNTKLDALHQRYYPDEEAEQRERGVWDGTGRPQSFELQQLTDVHLATESDPQYSMILSAIGLGILLIACINFMTLAIARSATRRKEVGVRKVVGARRRQVASQFWSEAQLICVVGLVLGLILAYLFLPVFSDLSGKNLSFDFYRDWPAALMLLALLAATGLIAGAYPAVVLSGFKPTEVFRNRHRLGGSNALTRSLVVVQFTLSVFLIISTIVMHSQMHYLLNRDLGFDDENVVVVRNSGLDGREVARQLRTLLADEPTILGTAAVGNKLGYRGSSGMRFEHEGERHNVDLISIDANFLDMMDIAIAEGRDFDPTRPSDSTDAAIVNRALVDAFGLTDPVGKTIPGFPGGGPTIVGVTDDFNYQLLYQNVGPLMLSMRDFWGFRYTMVRVAPGNVSEATRVIADAWANVAPEIPFSFYFLDEDIRNSYQSVQRWSTIVNYASIVSLLIACLGLFGLVSLSVAGRTKEIGIRKVLGAQTSSIAATLSAGFLKLVVVGTLIAVPIGFITMRKWLESFAFRVEIGFGAFLLAAMIAAVLALLTVGYQSARAAMSDPVQSLRYE